MTKYPFKRIWTLLCLLLVSAPVMAQKEGDQTIDPPDDLDMPSTKPLTPEEALKAFVVEDGFEVQLVAAEPLIEDPVCMAWDPDGRLWVAEMKGYMPNPDAIGEDEPIGNIVILTDTDGDGVMDEREVFLDKIVLPRAIAFTKSGILYADHTTLYHVKINTNGTPGPKQAIDKKYSDNGGKDGNVEHQANGLLYGLDNWYYNAKSSRRYKELGGRFRRSDTEFRGQWGITQDDDGRLLANGNSVFIQFELFPPSATLRNPNFSFKAARSSIVVVDKATYPIRPTPNVNRAYNPQAVSHETWKLIKATAACGPVIYRATQFPAEYYNNVFIPEPAGHLLKRVVLETGGPDKPSAKQAYKNKEFLATTDERCRFVNAYVGPDGCLYLVDMYRGLFQHKHFLSSYLRRQVVKRGLDKPVGMGRIYRVVHKDTPVDHTRPALSDKSSVELVPLLGHANAWHRETAQRLIVGRNDEEAVPALVEMATKDTNTQARIHALWTLNGMMKKSLKTLLEPAVLATAGQSTDPRLWPHILRLSEQFEGTPEAAMFVGLMQRYALNTTWEIDLQLAFTAGTLAGIDTPQAYDVLLGVLKRRDGEVLFRHAAVSGLRGKEAVMLTKVSAGPIVDELNASMAKAIEAGDLTIGALLEIIDKPEFRKSRDGLLHSLANQAMAKNRSGVLLDLIKRMGQADTSTETQLAILSGIMTASKDRNTPAELDGKPALFEQWEQSPPAELGKLIDELIALNAAMQDAIYSGEDISTKPELKDKSAMYLVWVETPPSPLAEIIENFQENKAFVFELESISPALAARLENGRMQYGTHCSGCHGQEGEGLFDSVGGPPLIGSEWVVNSPRMLAAIALVGLEGDIEVNGTIYSSSNDVPSNIRIQSNMGGMRGAIESDQDMADILTYIRSRNMDNNAPEVDPELVKEMRALTATRTNPYKPADAWKINVADGGEEKPKKIIKKTVQSQAWLNHSGRNLVITLVAVIAPLGLLLLTTVLGAKAAPLD